jgi:hypothetical protein
VSNCAKDFAQLREAQTGEIKQILGIKKRSKINQARSTGNHMHSDFGKPRRAERLLKRGSRVTPIESGEYVFGGALAKLLQNPLVKPKRGNRRKGIRPVAKIGCQDENGASGFENAKEFSKHQFRRVQMFSNHVASDKIKCLFIENQGLQVAGNAGNGAR